MNKKFKQSEIGEIPEGWKIKTIDEIKSENKKLNNSIFQRISNNCFENRNLSQIRDLLLPKLMSGKIRVNLK